jgi:dTDP-4-dehydrorhamnose 3,5-epimerase
MDEYVDDGWRPVDEIRGARIRDLRWNPDDRGALTELFRESWEGGRWAPTPPGTGEDLNHLGAVRQVYMSETLPGVVKGFHFHLIQWDRFVCVRGRALVVLGDNREGSPTYQNVAEVVLDPDRAHRMLVIPPGVLHGWMPLGNSSTLILNCVSREYIKPGRPGTDEFRVDPHAPLWAGRDPYDWRRRRDE